ncbi:MAG: BamA/TamA family outer membrane protein [Deltaproteobacteria bacterium]|nr:BamA/TamA family outer membrane protein [Deltaproteobacteria bacterium]
MALLLWSWLAPPAWAGPFFPGDPQYEGLPAEPTPEADSWLVSQVRLLGAQSIPQKEILSQLETHSAGLLERDNRVDKFRLARDTQRILRLYHDNGFYNCKVTSKLKHLGGDSVDVEFTIDEGPPALVEKVELLYPDQRARETWQDLLKQQISLPKGTRFRLEEYDLSKSRLKNALGNEAHPEGKVQGQVLVYPEENRVVVRFQIDPGPRLLFGRTRVTGNTRVSDTYILRQLTYNRGEPFNLDDLDATRLAVMDTGFFSTVAVHTKYGEISGQEVPVVLEVVERPAQSIQLGLGWGNEDQFRVKLQQVNRNLLGWNETLTLEGKYSSIYQGLLADLHVPDIFTSKTALVVRGGLEELDEEAYLDRRLFATPVLVRELDKKWSVYAGYNVETDNITDLKTDVPDPSFEKQDFFISSIPVGLKYDGRNSLLNPTEGTLFILRVETSLDVLGSELDFVRPEADLRHVLPLPYVGKEVYLASRIKAGVAYKLPGTDRIPLIRRFFPGGADSVRGYPYQSLGPLDSQGKPLGGEAMVEGSLELRFPIYSPLGGVVFVDAGNAFESIKIDGEPLRFTAGVGLRYNTPVGPLRLDFGYQLNPPEDSPLNDDYEVYLSVGQAF